MKKIDGINNSSVSQKPELSKAARAVVAVKMALAAVGLTVGLTACSSGGSSGGSNTPPDTIAPIANADNFSTPYNTAITGMDVLANDSDNSGVAPTLTGTFIGTQTGGTFTVNAGKIDFTPTPGFTGTASANYEIQDAAHNKSIGTVSVTVNPDITAPSTTVAPSVSGTTDVLTNLSATIDEDGTGYWLAVASGSAAPDVDTVIAANHSFAMTANTLASTTVSGLTQSTAYDIYFVAKDAVGNKQAAVAMVTVTTTATPDVTPPTTTAAPSVSGTTDTSTSLSATINEPGTGYYLVLASGATAPTVDAVIAANNSFAMAANTLTSTTVSGLSPTTAYDIYFVAKDTTGNTQAAVAMVTVTTTATIDATLPNTPTLTLNSGGLYINSTTVPVSITNDTDNIGVTGWYVSESSSIPALASFGAEPTSVTISSGDGVHNLYAFTRDAAGNISAAGTSSVSLDTVAPASPVFFGATPSIQWARGVYYIDITDTTSWVDSTGLIVTSLNSGTIYSYNISGNRVTIDYQAPNAVSDRIRITGADKAGNLFGANTPLFTLNP